MARKKTTPQLPDYKNPPVIEVAFGVKFAALANFKIPHFGLFWNEVINEFPRCQWSANSNAHFGVEFLPDGQVRYVIFATDIRTKIA